MRQKTIKFGRIKIKLFESPKFSMLQLNFGRYKKGKKIDTWMGDEIWLDIQNKKAIGMNITLDRMR